jgi:hypothetical protein
VTHNELEGVRLMNEAFSALREQLQTTMERLAIPGVAYGVSINGKVLVDGLGVTSG